MPIEESQLLDAPVTPGHVFAYRAFRNFFVGSPDSSPIRPTTAFLDEKENIYEADAKSPGKRSHGDALFNSATPKRVRTNGVSPSKSILRNPAEPTPRRAMLKDVNVTFKDARKTISPEINKKSVPLRTKSPSQHERVEVEHCSTVSCAKSTIKTMAKEQPLDTALNHVTSERTSLSSTTIAEGSNTFDVKEYMRTTEQEMRKLLKYGQKMREIANKHAEENSKLKALLREVQDENARLKASMESTALPTSRQRLEIHVDNSKNLDNVSVNKKYHEIPDLYRSIEDCKPKSTLKKHQNSFTPLSDPYGTEKPLHGARRTFDRNNQSSVADSVSSQKQVSRSLSRQFSASKSKPDFSRTQSQNLKTDRDGPSSNEKALKSTSDSHDYESTMANQSASHDTGKPSVLVNGTSQIPPDRKAAARERLRRRTEMRKASLGLVNRTEIENVGNVDDMANVGHERMGSKIPSRRKSSSMLGDQDSQLDWVGV